MWNADPSLLDAGEVARRAGTDPTYGLTAAEAFDRLERFGPNRLDPAATVPTWRKLLAQFADPLIYLQLAAIVGSAAAGAIEGAGGLPIEAIVIAAIVLANGVLGFLQERQAEAAVAALQRMAAPMAEVIRDGEPRSVVATELVPGDLLVLEEGNAVSADARLLTSVSLSELTFAASDGSGAGP